MKIDPVNVFVKQRVGHWGEAILHLGARRAESATRAQTMAARDPDDGRGVALIGNMLRGGIVSANLKDLNRIREIEEEVAREKGIDVETLRRMVAKVEEYSESHRAFGLPDDLLTILKDDLERSAAARRN